MYAEAKDQSNGKASLPESVSNFYADARDQSHGKALGHLLPTLAFLGFDYLKTELAEPEPPPAPFLVL